MNTINSHIKIKDVFFRDGKIFFSLENGREVGSPLKWFPRLYEASEEESMDFSISPSGYGVHWNRVDEDLFAYGLLHYDQDEKIKST